MTAVRSDAPTMVSPPEMFGIVEPDVYRTKQIYPHNFEFVKRLGLKTLVKLTPETAFKAVSSFCEEQNIDIVCADELFKPDLWL